MRQTLRRIPLLSCLFVFVLSHAAEAQVRVGAPITLSGPIGDGTARVISFHGSEGLSEPFSFSARVSTPSPAPIALDALLGQPFTVSVPQADGSVRHFSGICNRISQGIADGDPYLQVEMVPQFWLLTRNARSRSFQDLTVPQIIARVLGEHRVTVQLSVQGSYPRRDCVVQYRETDFAFLSRMMEEEGIFYFFRHQPGGVHTMVIGDGPAAHLQIAADALAFHRGPGNRSGNILSWEKRQELRSGRYTLRDHTFELPGSTLEVTGTIQESVTVGEVEHRLLTPANAALEIYDFPGEYAQRFDGVETSEAEILAEGERTVQLRAQRQATESVTIEGTSDTPLLMGGHRFALVNHPGGADGEYVLTDIQHSARASSGDGTLTYSNTFTCIPAGLPFRPERSTAIPVIPGVQAATVTGPAGETVHTDGHGRVKVLFPWDRENAADENSSCWVPVGQLQSSGTLVLPEVGDEVVVAFLEGDPDQPVIVGAILTPD